MTEARAPAKTTLHLVRDTAYEELGTIGLVEELRTLDGNGVNVGHNKQRCLEEEKEDAERD